MTDCECSGKIVGKEGGEWQPSHERLFVFERCFNFRQLGGYVTEDGKSIVKYGKLYRAAALHSMTENDKASLKQRTGVDLIMDLRYSYEFQVKPDPVIEGIEEERVPCVSQEIPLADYAAVAGNGVPTVSDMSDIEKLLKMMESAKEITGKGYTLLPFKNVAIGRLLAHMRAGRTILWHCSAGKDRTGVLAMVALAVLGVPLATIVEDYMLTNTCSQDHIAAIIESCRPMFEMVDAMGVKEYGEKIRAMVKDFAGVHAENIKAAYNAIFTRYGSIEKYVQEEYGVSPLDIMIIRTNYLESISG